MESGMHFVLVHGVCLGGWCWYKLKPLLEAAGHRVTALDLGGCGVHPRRLDEIASLSDYLQPLMDFMASLEKEDRVVLVGHSYGGLGVSLAMERFPEKISVAVFITAYMPNYKDPPATLIQEFLKRTSMESVMDSRFAFDQGPENPPTSVILGPEYTATVVYQHCQPERLDITPSGPKSLLARGIEHEILGRSKPLSSKDKELAKMLLRPNGLFIEDLGQESILTEARYGSVSRVYVLCEEDGVMGEEFQHWLIQNSPPKEVKSMAKAGHMVMLSKPKDLAFCLQKIVDEYH